MLRVLSDSASFRSAFRILGFTVRMVTVPDFSKMASSKLVQIDRQMSD